MSDIDLITRNLRAVVQTDEGRCRFVNAVLAVGLEKPINLAALKVIPYAAYLRTAHWRDTSRAAKERAGNRCQICNSAKDLEAHHRTYARRGEEQPGDLTVLCDKCHSKHHDKLPRENPLSDEPPATPPAEEIALDSMTDAEQNAWLQQVVERKRAQQKAMADAQSQRERDYRTSIRSGT